MLAVQPRRWLSRPKGLLVFAISIVALYWLLVHDRASSRPNWHNDPKDLAQGQAPLEGDARPHPFDKPKGKASTGKPKSSGSHKGDLSEEDEERKKEEEEAREEGLRQQFILEHEGLTHEPGADAIYANTLNTLVDIQDRPPRFESQLKAAVNWTYFSTYKPYIYDPYPNYNSHAWLEDHARYFPCEGHTGGHVEDFMVFKGKPRDFPGPLIGSYGVLGLDGDLCFERETRLSMYGFQNANDTSDADVNWDKVRWGSLQEKCIQKNRGRFNMQGESNPFLSAVYSRQNSTPFEGAGSDYGLGNPPKSAYHDDDLKVGAGHSVYRRDTAELASSSQAKVNKPTEGRTAVLLRSYTGKEYNENDKQVIRSLITELSLRTGGLYQVYLFVHVKDSSYAIWDEEATYQYVLEKNVPSEFRDITILWNDEATQAMYPKLDPEKATVHVAQWLSVQKFAQEFSEFDYIWNWEMDARVTGHHYDFLEKLVAFAKKQPRRGLWERNERYYIPSIHGDYDTQFRKEVERRSGEATIWGPAEMPFITPVGPEPPVADPKDDDYMWGVGEEADLITVAPIFNVNNSKWIGGNDVWGFNDSSHATLDLPRRATIVTHSRVSKKLLDIMHVENLRGNHIASEMTCQTVALLHGLKTVYAPMPMFFDRPWKGTDLARWFNSGRKGESGGYNSAMGWGREARYGGSTWYYRATPPQRLYNNLMGYEDTSIGGMDWEDVHGRTCLPPMMLHPIKDVAPTEYGYKSESVLPFG